jgi:hypothetical protein
MIKKSQMTSIFLKELFELENRFRLNNGFSGGGKPATRANSLIVLKCFIYLKISKCY